MHTTVRPYLTAGIAMVGASVITVAPLTVPQPEFAAVEVAAVDAVRSVTADVELTAFVDAFIAAFPEAVQRSVEFVTTTLPAVVESLITSGQFGHLFAIAVEVATQWPTVPLAPFIDVFQTELPLPFGTSDGVVVQAYDLTFTMIQILTDVATEIAQVIDGMDQPGDLPADLINVVALRIQSAMTSFQKIVTAFTAAISFSALAAPEGPAEARQQTLAVAAESGSGSPADPNAVPASVNPSSSENSTETLTVTVDTSAAAVDTSTDAAATATSELQDQSGDESQESNGDDVTPNGGTDMSDGNQAEPDIAGDGSTGQDDDGSTAVTEEDPITETPSGDDAATAAGDTGTDSEGSGDHGQSSE
jgi:hypothetical protein